MNPSSYHHNQLYRTRSFGGNDIVYYDQPPGGGNAVPVTSLSPTSLSTHQSRSTYKFADNNSQQPLSTSNWSLASSNDSAERVSLGSISSLPVNVPISTVNTETEALKNIDLLTRTSWIDAATALRQIEKVLFHFHLFPTFQ